MIELPTNQGSKTMSTIIESIAQTLAETKAQAEALDQTIREHYDNGTRPEPSAFRTLQDLESKVRNLEYAITVEQTEAGTPATYCIGSDRYAGEVVEVKRYKSGERIGAVREIVFKFAGRERTEAFHATKRGRWQSNYAGLRLGVAEDYRDPHF